MRCVVLSESFSNLQSLRKVVRKKLIYYLKVVFEMISASPLTTVQIICAYLSFLSIK